MIALITDIHFGSKNNNKPYFQSQMDFFEQQFFPYLIKNKIDSVVCLGDVFDSRQTIDTIILNEIRERFFGWMYNHEIKFYTLVGNHDANLNSDISVNTFKATGLCSTIHVIDKPTTIKIGKYRIGLIPWLTKEDTFNIDSIASDVDIIAGHFEIKNFNISKDKPSKRGFDISEFDKCKMVLSGHYHIKDQKHNITYLGNPFQKDWGDFNLEKGFHVLKDNFELEFIPNTISPRFIKFCYSESEEDFILYTEGLGAGNEVHINDIKKLKTLLPLFTNNNIRLILYICHNKKRIDKIYDFMVDNCKYSVDMINAVEIIEDCNFDQMESEILEDSDIMSVFKSFMENTTVASNISMEKLNDMFHEIYIKTLMEDMSE